jgi:DNA-binding NarL/FixJ family response regulator
MKTVVSSILPLVGRKELHIKNNIDPKADLTVLGDENRLYQIFFNLIDNAVKFTEKGTVTIEARISESSIEITVSDTGIGIPLQDQETIFLPYEQGGDSRALEYGGTGIGLSVVKNLVELQSGRIFLKSKPGSGTVFTIRLPAAAPPPEEDTRNSRGIVIDTLPIITDSEPQPVPAANAVWICDDDPVNLKVLKNIASETGFPVYCFSRGEALLKAVRQNITPVLILLDVIMPGMDGLETCREIRKLKDSSELPIILVTARSRTDDMVQGFKAGASDYVTKPVERQELLARMGLHLDLVRKTTIHLLKEKQAKIVEILVSVIGLLGGSADNNGEQSPEQERASTSLEERLEKELAVYLKSKSDQKNNHQVNELIHRALVFGREHRGLFRSLTLGGPDTDTKSALEDAISGLLTIIRSTGNNKVNSKCLSLGLTPREGEIAELTCQGFQNGEIADLLGISENTVKHHLYNIFNKTGADTRTHLVHLLNS